MIIEVCTDFPCAKIHVVENNYAMLSYIPWCYKNEKVKLAVLDLAVSKQH